MKKALQRLPTAGDIGEHSGPKKRWQSYWRAPLKGAVASKVPGLKTQATTPLCAWRAGTLRLRGARRVSAPMMLMILWAGRRPSVLNAGLEESLGTMMMVGRPFICGHGEVGWGCKL